MEYINEVIWLNQVVTKLLTAIVSMKMVYHLTEENYTLRFCVLFLFIYFLLWIEKQTHNRPYKDI